MSLRKKKIFSCQCKYRSSPLRGVSMYATCLNSFQFVSIRQKPRNPSCTNFILIEICTDNIKGSPMTNAHSFTDLIETLSRSVVTTSLTFFTVFSVAEPHLLDHFSSCKEIFPVQEHLCQSNTILLLQFLAYSNLHMNFQVSMGIIPLPTQNFIAVPCAVLFSDIAFFEISFSRYTFSIWCQNYKIQMHRAKYNFYSHQKTKNSGKS